MEASNRLSQSPPNGGIEQQQSASNSGAVQQLPISNHNGIKTDPNEPHPTPVVSNNLAVANMNVAPPATKTLESHKFTQLEAKVEASLKDIDIINGKINGLVEQVKSTPIALKEKAVKIKGSVGADEKVLKAKQEWKQTEEGRKSTIEKKGKDLEKSLIFKSNLVGLKNENISHLVNESIAGDHQISGELRKNIGAEVDKITKDVKDLSQHHLDKGTLPNEKEVSLEQRGAIIHEMATVNPAKTAALLMEKKSLPPNQLSTALKGSILNQMAAANPGKLAQIYHDKGQVPSPLIENGAVLGKFLEKVSEKEMPATINRMAEECLLAKTLPPKSPQKVRQFSSAVMAKVASICGDPTNKFGGKIEKFDGGSGGVYKISVEGKPIIFAKRVMEEPGMPLSSGVVLDQDLIEKFGVGQGPLREHAVNNGDFGFRLTAYTQLKAHISNSKNLPGKNIENDPEFFLLTDAIQNSKGNLEPFTDYFASQGMFEAKLVENRVKDGLPPLTPEELKLARDEWHQKIVEKGKELGIDVPASSELVTKKRMTFEKTGFKDRINLDNLQKLEIFHLLYGESDPNGGNIFPIIHPKTGEITFEGIDNGLSGASVPMDQTTDAFYNFLPQSKESLTPANREMLANLDIDKRVEQMRADYAAGGMDKGVAEKSIQLFHARAHALKYLLLDQNKSLQEAKAFIEGLFPAQYTAASQAHKPFSKDFLKDFENRVKNSGGF